MKRIKIVIVISLLSIFQIQCKKEKDFLSIKSDMALAVPTTLEEFQLMLRNENIFNTQDPCWGGISSEEFEITDNVWLALPQDSRNSYIWADDIFEGVSGSLSANWSMPYQQIYYTNLVLEGVNAIDPSVNLSLYNTTKGTALFYRSLAFYNLVQLFAKPYNNLGDNSGLGIPLRLSSDMNIKATRSSIQECYDQIVGDLRISIDMLPSKADYITRPSIAAGHALLARIYLSMGDYENAFMQSNLCLDLQGSLTDYSKLTPFSWTISRQFLEEVLFHSVMYGSSSLAAPNSSVITSENLYNSYTSNDLRKTLFFGIGSQTKKPYFRGSYDIKTSKFSGLATDEIYLIRAECLARGGIFKEAMADLNKLLRSRWKKDHSGKTTYVDQVVKNGEEALALIFAERRKQLVFRGLRWGDLRRLNLEGQYTNTLSRTINGFTYTLPPNDPRYVFPIPSEEIELSKIEQNIR